jgi:IclR family pca regulon transcriptional regulator
LIERSADGRLYQLGPRALAIGAAAQPRHPGQQVQDLLNKLRDETMESVGLSRRFGYDAIVLARAQSRLAVAANIQVGTLFPGHATSAGRALLAQLPPAEVERKFHDAEFVRYTPHTPATGLELIPLLAAARDLGYAVEHNSFVEGLTCIAVPVPVRSGVPSLALGMAASSTRWDGESISSMAPRLNATAAAVAELVDDDPVLAG